MRRRWGEPRTPPAPPAELPCSGGHTPTILEMLLPGPHFSGASRHHPEQGPPFPSTALWQRSSVKVSEAPWLAPGNARETTRSWGSGEKGAAFASDSAQTAVPSPQTPFLPPSPRALGPCCGQGSSPGGFGLHRAQARWTWAEGAGGQGARPGEAGCSQWKPQDPTGLLMVPGMLRMPGLWASHRPPSTPPLVSFPET